MRIVFFHSDKPRETLLANAFADGVRAHTDDSVRLQRLEPEVKIAEDADVVCMVGVKSRELFWAHWRAGIHTIYFDKGYTRQSLAGPIKIWEYWRVAVDGHHPTPKLMSMSRPVDRINKLGIEIKPWRITGDQIVIAGSSAKYHDFYGLSDPTRYSEKVIGKLKRHTNRQIIYRPKPSWKEAVPINGSTFSTSEQSIEEVLRGAHALVTHGSNACFEAVLLGVPCVVLGEAVAKPISSTELRDIERLKLATLEDRMQWLSNLAYCQWTLKELASGEAWNTIRPQIYG